MHIDLAAGNPGTRFIFIGYRKIAVRRRVGDGKPLRAFVAVRVDHALHAPRIPGIDIDVCPRGLRLRNRIVALRRKALIGRCRRGIEIVVRSVNFKRSAGIAVRTAVEHMRVKLLLHGIDVIVCRNLVPVLPDSILVEGDSPCLVALAFAYAVCADVLIRDVNRIGGRHLVRPLIARCISCGIKGKLYVIEPHSDKAHNDTVGIVFPCMRVPRRRRGRRGRLIGKRLTADNRAGCRLVVRRRRRNRRFSFFQRSDNPVLHGRDRGIARAPGDSGAVLRRRLDGQLVPDRQRSRGEIKHNGSFRLRSAASTGIGVGISARRIPATARQAEHHGERKHRGNCRSGPFLSVFCHCLYLQNM